ncbi:MAG: DUF2304 domain-containing protein [Candidatus Uhrbacteria bacterium]
MAMRYILIAAAVLGIVWTIGRFRKRHVSILVASIWCVLWVGVGVVALIPEATNRLADFFGIGRGADVVLYSAIVVILALVFRMSVRLEQLDRAITRVTREIALREHKKT